MPTFLPAPGYRPGGPDGQGWNRLTLAADLCLDECALRPRSYATLWESLNRPACVQYGLYGPCGRGGDCRNCPVFNAAPQRLHRMDPDDPHVLVRVFDNGQPRVIVNPDLPDNPGNHWSYPWTWEELRRLEGWKLGEHGWDEWGEWFWLVDVRDPAEADNA